MANQGISEFSVRFSAALQGFMREHKVRVDDVVRVSGRSKGYVSMHTNGTSAPDTDLLDAVAELTDISTVALVAEIVRRMDNAAASRADREEAAAEAGADAAITRLDEHLGRPARTKDEMQQLGGIAARKPKKRTQG